jgi:hypothetical protein
MPRWEFPALITELWVSTKSLTGVRWWIVAALTSLGIDFSEALISFGIQLAASSKNS